MAGDIDLFASCCQGPISVFLRALSAAKGGGQNFERANVERPIFRN